MQILYNDLLYKDRDEQSLRLKLTLSHKLFPFSLKLEDF